MKPYAEVIDHTDVVIEMLPIRGGKFLMGSPPSEKDRNEDEGPQHEVKIGPFWMGKYEITRNQYEIWGENIDISRRKIFGTPATPRDGVADAVTRPTPPYTDMSFSRQTAEACDLHDTTCGPNLLQMAECEPDDTIDCPEAEWEYACRAGTTTTYSVGDDAGQLGDFAWYDENSNDSYHDVGQKNPNPWGLYDMHGNTAEWVLDWYLPEAYGKRSGSRKPVGVPWKLYPRIVRGGGWDDDPTLLRSAVREGSSDEWKDQDPQIPRSIWYHTDALGVGFRVVRPLVEPSDEEKSAKWEKTAPVQLDPVVE